MYTYASDHIVSTILTQVNNASEEHPITFMSHALKNAKEKYNLLEKKDFTVVKVVKNFKVFIIKNETIAFVRNLVLKTFLTNQ